MQSPKVSVCMPMYNASRYLRECIDSVLAQTFTDFEFLIADDGSEDNSIAIIESYTDPRIRLIKREHGYISTLNNLLDEAKGEYIARMDADDIMLPSRLKHQYDYLESHTEVDVLGGGVIQFGDTTETHTHFAEYISILEMIDGCIIAHPTVMMRRQTLERLHLRYSANFAFAEDYELWVRMLKNGCIIRNLKEPLLRYRISDNQLSFTHSAQQSKLSKQIQLEALKFLFDSNYKVLDKEEFVSDSDRDLSVIIPFLNEGDEVLNTVKSVRETAGRDVEIIVINDNSTDGRDYYLELSSYNVRYYRNETRIGAALSKERGIKLCPTPYFIILDAHMRCYDSTWYTSIIDILKEKPNQLLCTNSTPLTKNRITGVAMEQKNLTPTFGAHMTLTHDRYLPFISWTAAGSVIPCINEHEIPCIYGAGYASSRNYWQSLGGLRGLIHYGCEEQFISIKAWLDGGGCRLLPSTFMGHIYRDIESAPFRLVGVLHIYNYLAICETLFPISTKCLGKAILWRLAKSQFIQASEIFRTVGRKYLPINNKTTKYDFQFILDSNSVHHPNDKVLHAIRQTECETIEQIVKYYSNVESPGICAGMMSGVVTLAHCNAFYPNNDRISKLSLKLLQKVNDSLNSGQWHSSVAGGLSK